MQVRSVRTLISILMLCTGIAAASCVDRSYGVCVGFRRSAQLVAEVAHRYELGEPVCSHGDDYVVVTDGDAEVYGSVFARLRSDGWIRQKRASSSTWIGLENERYRGVTVEFWSDTWRVEVRYR